MNAYHWLQLNMTAGYGSEPAWTVPETRSLPDTVALQLCRVGYHSSPTLFDGLQYAPGPIACLVEVSEPVERDATKQVSRSRTLLAAVDVSRELRLFAADCAEHIYEAAHPGNERPRKAIATARAFANGEATLEELRAAADAAFVYAYATARATNAAFATAFATERQWQRARFDEIVLPALMARVTQ